MFRISLKQLISRIRQRADKLKYPSDKKIRDLSLDLKYQANVRPQPETVDSAKLSTGHRGVAALCWPSPLRRSAGVRLAYGARSHRGNEDREGKTLTASLAAYLFSLYGRGVHVVTFNEYLAKRDREFLLPVFDLLGVSVSVLTENQAEPERRKAYQAAITYGAAKEFGFDFLRDRIKLAATGSSTTGLMRGTHFALVDEADSILIDESRTPLIIGMINQSEEQTTQQCYRWSAEHADAFVENEDYQYDHIRQSVKLTASGIRRVRNLPQNSGTKQVSIRQLFEYMQNAIKVRRDFQRDKNYAIREGEVVIIDEFTGRPAEGRQWQRGIHQSVQAKESLEITPATRQAAGVTIQTFFRRYTTFAGMTGTAWTAKREFKKVYQKHVVQIPTYRPCIRIELPVRVHPSVKEKYAAVAVEAQRMVEQGRAVLIGTRSVEASEALSSVISAAQIEHQILNARNIEAEATIVEQAGQRGRVTVATNMAGRGTDIKLHPSVRDAGGLHVILTEIHESSRIDQQLIGRGARQGDPGSFRIHVSLEDEILQIGFGPDKATRLRRKYAGRNGSSRQIFPIFLAAQSRAESRHLTDRLMVLERDKQHHRASFDTGQDPFLSVVGN